MSCPWRASDLALLLIWMVFFVADSSCSCVEEKQRTQNSSSLLAEVNTTMSVLMGTQALLCCPPITSRKAVIIIWTLYPRGQPSHRISYNVNTKEINETNCTDGRISWSFTPDQSIQLQISDVAITHDGHYTCVMATPDGNFQRGYDLQVLVPPEVTLVSGQNGTAVCEAVAGKPAARLYWTPEGDCVTENETHSNDTVTVRSTCSWEQNNVSAVSCSVFHLTGNKTLSTDVDQGVKSVNLEKYYLNLLFILLPTVLIIIGFIWIFKTGGFRKCKCKKSEMTPAVEEDEMQPYASYTEKNNPLYDTVSKMEGLQVFQGEADRTGLNTLSATGV